MFNSIGLKTSAHFLIAIQKSFWILQSPKLHVPLLFFAQTSAVFKKTSDENVDLLKNKATL